MALWREVLEGRMSVPSVARQDATQPNVAVLSLAKTAPPATPKMAREPLVREIC